MHATPLLLPSIDAGDAWPRSRSKSIRSLPICWCCTTGSAAISIACSCRRRRPANCRTSCGDIPAWKRSSRCPTATCISNSTSRPRASGPPIASKAIASGVTPLHPAPPPRVICRRRDGELEADIDIHLGAFPELRGCDQGPRGCGSPCPPSSRASRDTFPIGRWRIRQASPTFIIAMALPWRLAGDPS